MVHTIMVTYTCDYVLRIVLEQQVTVTPEEGFLEFVGSVLWCCGGEMSQTDGPKKSITGNL